MQVAIIRSVVLDDIAGCVWVYGYVLSRVTCFFTERAMLLEKPLSVSDSGVPIISARIPGSRRGKRSLELTSID